ncbi:hypothetical protein L1049_026033 [Liquidambar formosana]|uniref:Aspartic proteinase Asp1 n=1 Tax=Liquidambar formosana TaxID=63359 RepID=A0AAP0NCK7_LIQFO
MYKELRTSFAVVALFLMVFSATFQGCFSAANQPQNKKKPTQPTASRGLGSSVIFPVHGNVYPDGIYTVSLKIGSRKKPYVLDVDTGSDLTWVQCDLPCTGCTKDRASLYKPNKNSAVRCNDPICVALHSPGKPCKNPDEQCDYEIEYADHGSSLGVLVKDSFPLQFINGSHFAPFLALGCGYNQQFSRTNPPSTDGVLGLGTGKASIVSQLHDLGLIRNVLGHCLSRKGGGFLFLGADLVPPSGINWAPMSNSLEKHYSSGPAELLFDGKSTGVKGLSMVFDSGSSYTYFSSQAYQTTLSLVRKSLTGKPLKDAVDNSLPVCWKGAKPFRSVSDVKDYFKPLVLSFTKAGSVQLQLPPEAYLIVTKHGNVCLGILNGTEVGLGNSNIIGDISMQDKLVIYDNEKQQIGWAPANCDRPQKS